MKAKARSRSIRLVGAELLLGAALAGCGRESPVGADDAGSYAAVAIDLSQLHRPPGPGTQQTCASLAAEVALRVTPERGAVQEFSRAIPAEASIIRFDSIAVTEGSVAFSVSITSNNGTVLYGGEATQQVAPPTFEVDLALAALSPVLQVCPGHMVLDRLTAFTESVRVLNRGIGALTYEAVAPMCERGPCIEFRSPSGTAVPGPGSQLSAFLPRMTTQTSLELRVQSPGGSVPVAVTLGQLPDLVIDTLVATDTVSFTERGMEQPVRVVVWNAGNAAAPIFKVAASYSQPGTESVTDFEVPGQPQGAYAYTAGPLLPGARVLFEGTIVFFDTDAGPPYRLWVVADSCSGDELFETYCRVDEFDEANNVSVDLNPFP
jgi:hypothetical protein